MPAFAYPFSAVPLSSGECASVRSWLAALDERYGLLRTRPGLLRLCEVFLAHCSPAAPAPAALEAMTQFLYLVMYFADRVSPATAAEDATQVLRALTSGVPDAVASLSRLAGALGQALRGLVDTEPGRLSSFLHLFRVNLGVFVWAASRPSLPASLDEHLAFRTESICAVAYLRLWGVLGGLSWEQETRFAFLLQEMETTSARVQALANDLRSVARDARDGTPNAVSLLAAHTKAASLEDAETAVGTLHDRALLDLVNAMDRARSFLRSGDEAVARYIDFVGICTRGNDTAMLELSARYDVIANARSV